jgi:hypothetical protein
MPDELIDHYYRVDIREGSEARPAYFYSTTGGLYDPRYGWPGNPSRMQESLTAAISEFRRKLQAKHDTSENGGAVTVSEPVEVTKDEVDRHGPPWGALVQRATDVIKKVIARSIDPINITWTWDWVDDRDAESPVRLKLSAETESVAEEFTPGELKDEFLMRGRILRLYDDLLKELLEKSLGAIHESILEHRKG